MKIINKKLILIVILIGILSSILICLNISDKETRLEIVSLNNETKQANMFAIMLEQEDGMYKESEEDTWPSSVIYMYDEVRSGCIDTNGNKIENALTYDSENKIASVETSNTSYCYLYFRIRPNLYTICNDYSNMNTCILEEYTNNLKYVLNMTQKETGGMYRYQGSYDVVDNNYICFGTNDLEICILNKDKYMYRIIGITSDGKMKLIKKEALDDNLALNSDHMWEHAWPTDEMHKYLNDTEGTTYFLNNEKLIPTDWQDRINLYSWKYGNIALPEDLGNIYQEDYANELYEKEIALSTTIDAKISLMYLHDYLYAGNWLNINNNDTAPISTIEWVMPYSGLWGVKTFGYQLSQNTKIDTYITTAVISELKIIRPVFYLENTIELINGNGTITEPYLIS